MRFPVSFQAPAINRKQVGDMVVTMLSDGHLDRSFEVLHGIHAAQAGAVLELRGAPAPPPGTDEIAAVPFDTVRLPLMRWAEAMRPGRRTLSLLAMLEIVISLYEFGYISCRIRTRPASRPPSAGPSRGSGPRLEFGGAGGAHRPERPDASPARGRGGNHAQGRDRRRENGRGAAFADDVPPAAQDHGVAHRLLLARELRPECFERYGTEPSRFR